MHTYQTHTHTHTYVYVYTYTHMYTYIHIYTCIHTHIHTCTYIYTSPSLTSSRTPPSSFHSLLPPQTSWRRLLRRTPLPPPPFSFWTAFYIFTTLSLPPPREYSYRQHTNSHCCIGCTNTTVTPGCTLHCDRRVGRKRRTSRKRRRKRRKGRSKRYHQQHGHTGVDTHNTHTHWDSTSQPSIVFGAWRWGG